MNNFGSRLARLDRKLGRDPTVVDWDNRTLEEIVALPDADLLKIAGLPANVSDAELDRYLKASLAEKPVTTCQELSLAATPAEPPGPCQDLSPAVTTARPPTTGPDREIGRAHV